MIEGENFILLVSQYFDFLIKEFGFKIHQEKIRGNAFYDLQFTDESHIISVSYENIEDYLQVIIFILQNGQLPDYDDKTKTLNLKKLTLNTMSKLKKDEILKGNNYFLKIRPQNEFEKSLLKSAKELRFVLQRFKKEQNF